MSRGQDRRVRYTKLFLREALLELMKEKPIGKITPTELCRRADINRNTFYAHYASPEELLRSIEDEMYSQIQASLKRPLQKEGLNEILTDICQIIYENRDLSSVLFGEYGDKEFLRWIIELARENSMRSWKKDGIAGETELLYTYSANGSIAVIQQWVMSGMKKKPEEIAAFLTRVSGLGIQGFGKTL